MSPRIILFICVAFSLFYFYESDEGKARKLLNLAIVNWDKGDYIEGYRQFEKIHAEFPTTKTATESVALFNERLNKYKKRYSLRMNFAINTGVVSSEVLRKTVAYYKAHQVYPDKIDEIATLPKVKYSGYLQYCQYERAVADLGFKLDCTYADVKYAEINNQQIKVATRWDTDSMTIDTTIDEVFELPIARQLDSQDVPSRSSRKEWQSVHRVATVDKGDPANIMPSGRPLKSFKLVDDDWGQRLNVRDSLPRTGFRALYFNANSPTTILHDNVTDKIAVSFYDNQGYGIDSQNFGAYWAGELIVTTPEVKSFTLNLSRASARLLINRREVLRSKHGGQINVALNKGVYLIEVEFLNKWHTTEFNAFISEPVVTRSTLSLAQKIRDIDAKKSFKPTSLVYVSSDRASNSSPEVSLDITPHAKAVHLFLNSRHATDWVITNDHDVIIKSITYSTYRPGSTVSGDVSKDVPLFAYQGYFDFFQDVWTCQCLDGFNSCDHNKRLSLSQLEQELKQIYSLPLTGYSLAKRNNSIAIPETNSDQANHYRIMQNEQKNAQIAKKCHANSNPDFGKVF